MTFVAHVTYWCEFKNSGRGDYKTVHCFLVAENLKEAMDYICDYYGDEMVDKVTLEAFGPDQMLVFEEDNIDEYATFNAIVSQLAPKQIW